MLHLLVLQFDSHHSEGVVGSIVVDVDAAEALLPRLDGHPLLTGIIVDHDRGPCLADALLTDEEKSEGKKTTNYLSSAKHTAACEVTVGLNKD